MKSSIVTGIGCIFLVASMAILSLGEDVQLNQKPVDFAHWFMLFAAVYMASLWFSLPDNLTKNIGLSAMTLGIAFIAGMCVIDFLIWAAHGNEEQTNALMSLVFGTPSIRIPFLMVGPSLFYIGLGVATYGLFKKFMWQVIAINIGTLFIGLGFMLFRNAMIPLIGSIILSIGIYFIIYPMRKKELGV